MKAAAPCVALLLSACAGTLGPQSGPGATPVGAPLVTVDALIREKALPAQAPPEAPERPRLPERIVLPAAYRLVIVDGHLTLVRESDPRDTEPGSPAGGDANPSSLAYQPALLPQELAAEVEACRESAARMDRALESVMQRSRELSQQAIDLQAQAKRLAQLLAESEARARAPAGPKGAADGAPAQ